MSPAKTGGAVITGYMIERCEIVSTLERIKETDEEATYTVTSNWVPVDLVDRYTLEYRIRNLTVGALYSVRVAAENSAGQGAWAEIADPVVAKSLYSRPEAPIGPILLTNMTRETVDASWHAPKYDGGAPVTSYFVEKMDLREGIWIKVARIDGDERSLKIINLVEQHDCVLRVCAENEYGMSDPLVSDIFKPLRQYGEYFKNFNLINI
jgi:hypothetical protein